MSSTPNMPSPPVAARHSEPSMVFSADDDVSRASSRLIQLALDAARKASEIDLSAISRRMTRPPYYPNIWPGEHYKLLAGLVSVLRPTVVLEIGTATGLSALSLRECLPKEGRVITFDLVPWTKIADPVLRQEDFEDGRIVQIVEDLTSYPALVRHRELLSSASLIFIDAAKDGVSESIFIDHLKTVHFNDPPIVVFDDIRLWNMLAIWREISAPKLDITSFGHWSGTGLIDWTWGKYE